MKRLIGLMLCLLILSGCGQSEQAADAWETVMTVSDIEPTGLSYAISSPTEGLTTGRAYTVERFENGTWQVLPTLTEPIFTTEGILIPMSDTINWEWLYGTLPSGRYRLTKEIILLHEPGDYETATVTAEFEIP